MGGLITTCDKSPILLFHRYFFVDFFNTDKLLVKPLHIITDFIIGNAGVYLCGFYVGVSQHLTNRFNGYTFGKRSCRCKSMPCEVEYTRRSKQ